LNALSRAAGSKMGAGSNEVFEFMIIDIQRIAKD
jgi:hypothetical protein